jgi:uncharacterized membrane protein
MNNIMEEYFVEEKTSFDKLLDFLVFISVFAVTVFLVLELVAESEKTSLDMAQINGVYIYVNIIVFIVFLVDLIRLWNQHTGFSDFIKHCWLDVLATIPFGLLVGSPAFEILKWARVSRLGTISKAQKLSRVSKISKQFKAASHLKKEGDEYKRKHRL